MIIKRIELLWEVRKKTNSMPYWYVVCPDDPSMMEPDPAKTSVLEEGIAALNAGSSLREVAEWITEKSGVKLSHMGLAKIWTRTGRERVTRKENTKKKKTLAEIKEARRRKRIAAEKNRFRYAKERVE